MGRLHYSNDGSKPRTIVSESSNNRAKIQQGYRVWVVEDDPVVRLLFADVARSRGLQVTEFGDVETAWSRYQVDPPHLILLDWLFPGMDGIELCRRIRATPHGRSTVIVMATIRNKADDLTAVLDSGADDYIPKPADASLIATRLAIAERTVAERMEMSASEGRYHSVIAAMAEGVVVLDRNACIVDINAAGEAILTRSKAALEGEILFGSDMSPVRRDGSPWKQPELPQYRTLEGGAPVVDVVVGIATGRDDCTWLSVNVQALGPANGAVEEGVVVSLNDVTARINAEEEREEMNARVQYSQKLEGLGVLAGGIAHEFNNLLVGILGNASLALMELAEDSPTRQLIEQIETASMRAADLTNQMLAYSGRGKFVTQKVRLDRMVEEMARLLSTAISKKAAIEYDFPDALPAVQADVSQLRQVVMNLATNASDALQEESGVILLRTGVVDVAANEILDASAAEPLPAGSYVFLEVVDNGVGMEEETLARIFDPFFTTKFTGRGLGLAAVLGIVRGHHGAIKVWSREGQGSSFKIFLPSEEVLDQTTTVPASAEATEPEEADASTILVVDDEEMVRQVTGAMLERLGYSVLAAADGQEGVTVYQRHARQVVAILLDLTMPVMSGEEAYRSIMEINPDARVLVMSGFNESDAVERFGGVDVEFIQKPFKPATLAEKLSLLISGSSPPGG